MASKGKYDDLPLSTSKPLPCALTGAAVLASPRYNKGSAFPLDEREALGLDGMLPSNVQTLEEQVKRAYQQYSTRQNDLAKNTFMTSLKDQNEVLYYRLIQNHLKEMFSIIYTPTEGEAIENFSRIFRRPEGCFLDIENKDKIESRLARFGTKEGIDYIVVSDGEEILGIGDQGAGAILISIAKLVLTTVCAGIHPDRVIPVCLDVGTDNQKLLDDDLYLGLRRPRVRGKEYDEFVDRFVSAVGEQYPGAYLHFEDFGLSNARRLLDQYRPSLAVFNDDVQGTGAVTLSAIMAGLHVSGLKLSDMRMIIFGSGSAGTGIADQVRDAIAAETGKSKEDASKQIWCVDKPGLLVKSQGDKLTRAQVSYARDDSEWQGKSHDKLLDVVSEVKPHVLIGTSTKPKAFTEDIVKAMAKGVDRPIILPLSNPTRLHEAVPEDLITWTEGKALIATGSPFPPVEWNGKKFEIAECNNSTVFPGIGLGVVLSKARLLSDKMLVAAVKALAAQSPALKDPDQALLPDVVEVRELSVKIAAGVIKAAQEEGLTRAEGIPSGDRDLEEWISAQMWSASYRKLVSAEH